MSQSKLFFDKAPAPLDQTRESGAVHRYRHYSLLFGQQQEKTDEAHKQLGTKKWKHFGIAFWH